MKEALIGILLMVIGAYSAFFFLEQVMQLIKGIIGPALLIIGFFITWIGYEDMREGL